MECIQKILSACEATGESAHFDLVKAKEKLQNDPNGMFFFFVLIYIVLFEQCPLKSAHLKP